MKELTFADGKEIVNIGPVPSGLEGVMESERPLQLRRPCGCGCDTKAGHKGAGYITGGTKDRFFSLWIQSEEAFEAISAVFQAHKLSVRG